MANKNNMKNGFDVDYTTPGAITPVNRLNTLLNMAMENQLNQTSQRGAIQPIQTYEAQPLTIEQAYSQPTEVRYINSKTIVRPRVPEIEIPYTEVWKASRLHPQNGMRYFWYPYYTIMTFISSPPGICITAGFLLLCAINFLLNGSYQGPGYAAGKKIELAPPRFATPVIKQLE